MEHIEIAERIANAGGTLYYVGGYVRDKFMNKEPKDIDFCVTGLSIETFSSLFPKAFLKGSFFPVFQLNGHDFAFARKETKTALGHKGFYATTENITIEEDLRRRDFTINSMAINVLTNDIIDIFGGLHDINNKLIRATSSAFSEDPLRVYRGAQFATRFDFTIENSTKELMRSMKSELTTLSAERVFEELKKALSAEKPSIFFHILRALDVLGAHFQEIQDLIGVIQPIEYHPEGDVYNHVMIVLDKVAEMTDDIAIRFSGLVHDIGKGITPKHILPHHYNHDINGINPFQNLSRRLNLPNSWNKLCKVIIIDHMRAGFFDKMTIGKQVSFLERNYHFLKELEIIAKADSKNPSLSFQKLGDELMQNVNGNTIKLPNQANAKEILHEKRVEYLKRKDLPTT